MTDILNESLFKNSSKYNTSLKLTSEDQKSNKIKIFCTEEYAQEMYDLFNSFNSKSGSFSSAKDLIVGEAYTVTAKTISYDDKLIYAEEINSKVALIIPFREYSKPIEELSEEENRNFLVTVYKSTPHGEFLASEKKALGLSYKQELFSYLENNTWFDVKITKLIKGGYLAIYKKEIECFIPGSHAAANVVHNFNELLGKTLTVMVDNYDSTNNLFILSYKKYITHSMPTMVSELQFDKEYTGTLTNKPYEFGIFVEFENYYTGLLHKSEFENYEEISKTMKTGDKIKVYVKDVTSKNDQYRIVLTLNKDSVSQEKLQWQLLRNRTENQSFKYSISESRNSISIEIDGENFEVSLRRKDLDKNLNRFPLVKVFKVDPINKRLKFEFVEDNS